MSHPIPILWCETSKPWTQMLATRIRTLSSSVTVINDKDNASFNISGFHLRINNIRTSNPNLSIEYEFAAPIHMDSRSKIRL